jgi:hypothetical protein
MLWFTKVQENVIGLNVEVNDRHVVQKAETLEDFACPSVQGKVKWSMKTDRKMLE